MSFVVAARKYIKQGISVIATDSSKRSLAPWKKYQSEILTDLSIFENDRCSGIAIVGGKISGNLEVIDVDAKYDLSGSLFNDLMISINDVSHELADRLKVVETKNKGYHIYYRCPVIGGNTKLASRPASEQEIKNNPNERIMVLIETRGEGGYVIAPPTEGYKELQGTLQEITEDERTAILEICRSFNQVIYEQPKPTAARNSEGFGVTPWEDYNTRGVDDMLARLEKHGWKIVTKKNDKIIFKRPGKTESKTSGDYSYTHNLFTVFTTSSDFDPLTGYRPAAVFTMLEHKGDFSEAGKELVKMGYGERKKDFGSKLEKEIFKRRQDGATNEDLITFLTGTKGKEPQEACEIIGKLLDQWGEKISTFWDFDKSGKIIINRYKLERFLSDIGGFYLYFYDKNSNIYRLVKVKDGFVEETSTENIKKFIKDYINTLPDTFDGGVTPQELLEVIYKGSETLFSKGFFEFLDRVNLDFLKDDPNRAYFPFKNGVVVIDKSNVTLKSYGELNKVIWKSEIIDFNITIDQSFVPDTCEYFRFLEKISGEDDDKRNYSLMVIGYVLHKYKDPGKPFAVVLAEETENEDEGGGTGKGIFVKALGYLIHTERMDGKNFKLDKNFAFQRVSLDTKLVAIEDVRKGFDFEGLYSIITEGITVEKKNKDELFIPYRDSPKIIIATNYTISSTGNHAKRRQRSFELTNFFSSKYTPVDLFGHNLFDDWDEDEWNRFYNLMFFSVSLYLENGLQEFSKTDKLRRKHIRLHFGDEFLDYWDQLIMNGCKNWHVFRNEYKNYLIENDFEKKEYSMKRFKKGLVVGCESFSLKLDEKRNRQQGNQHEFRVIVPGSDDTNVIEEAKDVIGFDLFN